MDCGVQKVFFAVESAGVAFPAMSDDWLLYLTPVYWAGITLVATAAAIASQFVPQLSSLVLGRLRGWAARREQRQAAAAAQSTSNGESEPNDDVFEEAHEQARAQQAAREEAAEQRWKEAQNEQYRRAREREAQERAERERERERVYQQQRQQQQQQKQQQQQQQQRQQQQQYASSRSSLDPHGYYAALGFRSDQAIRNCTLEDIKAAFRREALRNHPDMVPADQRVQANERMKKVIEAYQYLRKLHEKK
jgi:hypothetical protein